MHLLDEPHCTPPAEERTSEEEEEEQEGEEKVITRPSSSSSPLSSEEPVQESVALAWYSLRFPPCEALFSANVGYRGLLRASPVGRHLFFFFSNITDVPELK